MVGDQKPDQADGLQFSSASATTRPSTAKWCPSILLRGLPSSKPTGFLLPSRPMQHLNLPCAWESRRHEPRRWRIFHPSRSPRMRPPLGVLRQGVVCWLGQWHICHSGLLGCVLPVCALLRRSHEFITTRGSLAQRGPFFILLYFLWV